MPSPKTALALLLVAVTASAATPAAGDLRHSTTYRTNPIKGATPAELWRAMAARPILDEDGPALANITHDHTLSVETESSGGTCRVKRLDFTWKFVITLPEARDESRMSSATRAMWREFTGYLKRHEEHHRTIFLDCGKHFLAEAERITGGRTCFGMKAKVKSFIDKQYAACMVRQRAFDREDRPRFSRLAFRRAYRK